MKLIHVPLPTLLTLITLLPATSTPAQTTNSFRAYEVLYLTNAPRGGILTNIYGASVLVIQPLLDSSKTASITNRITLGQVVANLGPGWMSSAEGLGIIRWSFSDGQELDVYPAELSASTVLSSNPGAAPRFWFTTNGFYTPKSPLQVQARNVAGVPLLADVEEIVVQSEGWPLWLVRIWKDGSGYLIGGQLGSEAATVVKGTFNFQKVYESFAGTLHNERPKEQCFGVSFDTTTRPGYAPTFWTQDAETVRAVFSRARQKAIVEDPGTFEKLWKERPPFPE